MYTSYFDMARKVKFDDPVAICLYPPGDFRGRLYQQLAPPRELLLNYKAGRVSQPRYVEIYRTKVLDKLNPKYVMDDLGPEAVLLCFEPPGEFCHRHLAAEWLRSHGAEISEYSGVTSSHWFD